MELGRREVAGTSPLWINIGSAFLDHTETLPLHPGEVVLEVCELEEPTPELRARLTGLREDGYRLALDDFTWGGPAMSLLPLADVVKLDVLQAGIEATLRVASDLQALGHTVVAEKVEERADFERLRQAGIPLFQGWFYERPRALTAPRVPQRAVRSLQQVSDVLLAGDDLDRLRAVVAADATLTFRLLRLANSGFYGSPRRVETLHEAVVRIGGRATREWLTLMLVHGLGDPSHPALLTAVARARLCAELAGDEDGGLRDRCFLVGLLSTLDALLGPLPEALAEAGVSRRIRDALLLRTGTEGTILRWAVELQRGMAPAALNAGHGAELAVGAEQAASRTVAALADLPRC